MRTVMMLADQANRYIEQKKPWAMIKNEDQASEVQSVCTQGLNLFRTLMIYLAPVIPALAAESRTLFREDSWELGRLPAHHCVASRISKYKPLITRVEKSQVDKMIEQSRDCTSSADQGEEAASEISIDEFSKVDLRVAEIVAADAVEGADKLVRLTLDLGGTHKRPYSPESRRHTTWMRLRGRQVVAVANLKPRKMRFGLSEGMILAAGPGGSDIFLLSPDDGAKAGMRVK